MKKLEGIFGLRAYNTNEILEEICSDWMRNEKYEFKYLGKYVGELQRRGKLLSDGYNILNIACASCSTATFKRLKQLGLEIDITTTEKMLIPGIYSVEANPIKNALKYNNFDLMRYLVKNYDLNLFLEYEDEWWVSTYNEDIDGELSEFEEAQNQERNASKCYWYNELIKYHPDKFFPVASILKEFGYSPNVNESYDNAIRALVRSSLGHFGSFTSFKKVWDFLIAEGCDLKDKIFEDLFDECLPIDYIYNLEKAEDLAGRCKLLLSYNIKPIPYQGYGEDCPNTIYHSFCNELESQLNSAEEQLDINDTWEENPVIPTSDEFIEDPHRKVLERFFPIYEVMKSLGFDCELPGTHQYLEVDDDGLLEERIVSAKTLYLETISKYEITTKFEL